MSSLLGDLLGLGAGGALTYKAYQDIGAAGDDARTELKNLAGTMEGKLGFKPYGITSATGGSFNVAQGPDGQINTSMQLSPQEQALYEQQMANAGMFFNQAAMPTAEREQQVYDRMRAAQSPEEERQRLALESRLYNQGRSGVRSAMFGGTPEQLAMAKAQAEQRDKTMLAAMQFAGQEQQRQAGLGQGMLASAYVPQAQLLAGLQPGMSAAEQARLNQAAAAQAYGETYTSGLDALLQSRMSQANLASSLGGGLMSGSLAGLFS